MINWINEFAIATVTFNSIFGVLLYWFPMLICIVGYTIRTMRNFQKDKVLRKKVEQGEESFYSPTDTIGDVLGRALVSIVPIANLWAGLFDVTPQFLGRFFDWVEKTFDQPLVPKRPKLEED